MKNANQKFPLISLLAPEVIRVKPKLVLKWAHFPLKFIQILFEKGSLRLDFKFLCCDIMYLCKMNRVAGNLQRDCLCLSRIVVLVTSIFTARSVSMAELGGVYAGLPETHLGAYCLLGTPDTHRSERKAASCPSV